IRIKNQGSLSFGGDQSWFSNNAAGRDGTIAKYGCGVIAAADLLLYIARSRENCATALLAGEIPRREDIERAQYEHFLRNLSRHALRPLPPFGLMGSAVAACVNRRFCECRVRLRSEWRFFALMSKPLEAIREQLSRDIPVIMTIPPFPLKINSLLLARELPCGDAPSAAVRYNARSGHFVTAVALHEQKGAITLEISSWGRRYYIDWCEYLAALRSPVGALACGMVSVKDTERLQRVVEMRVNATPCDAAKHEEHR
ncbi:MAG: hypothetical protein RRY38_04280, partial [Oscillospiraceae bacterium]